jgi:hypothetical protein
MIDICLGIAEPTSNIAKISFKCKEKKRKKINEKKREEEGCHNNKKLAQNQGFCCHAHAKETKKGEEGRDQEEKWNGNEMGTLHPL